MLATDECSCSSSYVAHNPKHLHSFNKLSMADMPPDVTHHAGAKVNHEQPSAAVTDFRTQQRHDNLTFRQTNDVEPEGGALSRGTVVHYGALFTFHMGASKIQGPAYRPQKSRRALVIKTPDTHKTDSNLLKQPYSPLIVCS